MKPEPSIRIHNEPYSCTDGSINPGSIIVQNYLTKHYLDRATGILEKHGIEKIVGYQEYRSDPDDGERDSILVFMQDGAWNMHAALKEIHETSNAVEAADQILQKEIEARLKVEEEKFEKSVEAFKRIMED